MKYRSFPRRHFVLITLLAALALLAAFNADAAIRRLLLVGDSWPQFMWSGVPYLDPGGRVFREVFQNGGFGEWEEWGEYTALGTTMAREWAHNEGTAWGIGKLDMIRRELANNPSIDIVHVSLGGNDFGRADYRDTIFIVKRSMQTIVFNGTPTGGTFTLSFNGSTTPALPFNAMAAQVQSALEALPSIGAGNISVIDTSGGARYYCTFQGTLGQDPDNPPNMISADGTNLTIDPLGAVSNAGGYPVGTVDVAVSGFEHNVANGRHITLTGVPQDNWVDTHDPFSGGPATMLHLSTGLSAPVADGAPIYGYPSVQVREVEFDHGWKRFWGDFSPAEDLFYQAICTYIGVVMQACLDVRPDLHVALCDYDIMNDDGGDGTVQDKNEGGGRLSWYKYQLCRTFSAMPEYRNRCFYIGAFGLMQYHFGYPNPLPPGEQYKYGPEGTPGTEGVIHLPGGAHSNPPYTPFGGGDPRYPSPVISILQGVGGSDIHLRRTGYVFLAQYCMDQYYAEWLNLPKVLSVVRTTMNPMMPTQVFNPTGIAQVSFRVTFSKPVTGVDESDFRAAGHNGVAGASVESVAAAKNGAVYDVVVNTGVGDGTLTLEVVDNGTIKDAQDNDLVGDIDGSFASGESYVINRSITLPVAAWPAVLALLALGAHLVRKRAAR